MSEFIEKRRELSIQEYEFMKHLKLFTDDEIHGIKTKRFQHEHKVERRAKELPDFINYIVYENNVLELLAERRKKLRVYSGRHNLESGIFNRIRTLYKRAMDRFPAEYRLWTHYLRHCEKHKLETEGSRTLDKMLNYHGDKPKAWITAANWEYKQMNSMERARHFMFRGLQRHPECRGLYVNFLQLQLQEVEKILESSEEDVEELMEKDDSPLKRALECLKVVYEHYAGKDRDLEFFVEVLDSLKPCAVTREFGLTVLEDMKRLFAEKELMWNTLAMLELNGSHLLKETSEEKGVKSESFFKENLEGCVRVYENAVKSLPTKTMWSYYIDSMLKVNEDMSSQQKLRRKVLGVAFKNAFETGYLEEDKYVQYLKLLIHTDKPQDSFVTDVLDKALDAYPSSVKLWELRLIYLGRKQESSNEFDGVFKQSLAKCSGDVLPLWVARFQYYHTHPNHSDRLEQTFKDAINQPPTISKHFQPLYLDFLTITEDINTARKQYRQMQRDCCPCLELHRKMSQLESIQAQPNTDQWRLCHENATQYFGTTDPSVWIDYIRFEKEAGSPKNMPLIFERAKSRLDDDLVAEFITEYELLRNPLV
ncbi:U3 small nucleolar RNA-associated protein 6 homolog [Aedes albopictus]|uniref:U3 small nucleolar rna-associated protein 6 n=1 Tax=Aedes albopictus TaxID=7160 RepID=A0ABM1YA50_AEDAL|nr:U3 small nucleolar RNA-associated protein 6 homolog [Aedes albopictus]